MDFWNDYMFRYVFFKNRPKGAPRVFTPRDARKVWDSLVYLKIKCPNLDVTKQLNQLEKFMPTATKALA
jgi:hypothetical protein